MPSALHRVSPRAQNLVALAVFWLVLGGGVGLTGLRYLNSNVKELGK